MNIDLDDFSDKLGHRLQHLIEELGFPDYNIDKLILKKKENSGLEIKGLIPSCHLECKLDASVPPKLECHLVCD